ncbi:MAG: hypothetical protein B7O98_03965 [Zestosphaera tikiterensis]|uniref:Ferrous iron transporter FeoA-like domain-containing protein n=1 Tax=Zestosphaera tikiterensis TaxID=1973259 RepID=A0A2R7Y7R8_9CREN|nr:MAG: hypothetical protein B7O98_03965 [Zestosphaera tikiterensis]
MSSTTLADLPSGSKARVIRVEAGKGLLERLYQMGLIPNEVVEVMINNVGRLVVKVRGTEIALGRGIARKIFVETIEEKGS